MPGSAVGEAMDARVARQIGFIEELDRLKSVLRRTPLIDGSRRENSAEHSWHLALMALLLVEHADEPVDVGRVVALLLVHDVVEIDAGDTFAYDDQAVSGQAERERRAAERVFGLLPPDQAATMRALWEEFEARETPEARFAVALDRFQPMLHNYRTEGGTWRTYGVALEQVLDRAQPIAAASATLWAYTRELLERSQAAGYVRPAGTEGAPLG